MADTTAAKQELVSIPEAKRRRSLRFSIWDASFYAAMVGFAETYFVPLMLAIGATSFQVGIFTAAPMLCVAITQFASLMLVEQYRKRKKIIVSGVIAQAAALGFILYKTSTGNFDPWLLIAIGSVYFAANGMVMPAWNSLIGDLTTAKDRGSYFGRRSSISGPITFAAVAAGGLTLQHFAGLGKPLTGFAWVLTAALISRLGSIYSLVRHFDVPYRKVKDSYFSFMQFIRRSPKSNFAHFVYFQAIMGFANQISSPFFAVYMLRDLKFSYVDYMIAQGVFQIVQFMMMRRWGPLADRFGNRIILRITGSFLPLLPIMWLFSKNFYYIIAIQIFAGTVWAGWLLGTSNFVFDAVTPAKRARCAAYLNFFNSSGIFLGALLGAVLSIHAPKFIDTGALRITFFSSLEFIFVLSGLLRFLNVFFFMPTVHEVRKVGKPEIKDIFLMLTHIRPLTGSQFEIYTGSGSKENGNPPE
ncbi:MAG: MFS transporter [bacterium]